MLPAKRVAREMPIVVEMTTRGVAVGKMTDSVVVPKIGMAADSRVDELKLTVEDVSLMSFSGWFGKLTRHYRMIEEAK